MRLLSRDAFDATFQLKRLTQLDGPRCRHLRRGDAQGNADPNGSLAFSTGYTATVKGGPGGVEDVSGNALAGDFTWSFTTSGPPPPPPDQGPGGPILVVTGDPFGSYYAEILRAEGLNAFLTKDLSTVTAATLGAYDVAILANVALTNAQAAMFTDWVTAGGNLIAMRPDPILASLLGLTPGTGSLSNAYFKIDTTSAPGTGIVGQTIQVPTGPPTGTF